MAIRKTLKIIGVVLIVLILVAAGVGYYAFEQIRGEGAGGLERWIGGQLQRIVNTHLNPDLQFETLDYQYPRTVVVTSPRLNAKDPRPGGKRINVLAAESFKIELAKIPSKGEPIVIEQIRAVKPEVRLIGYQQAGGNLGFAGLTNLVKQPDQRQQQPDQESTALSDVFEIRLIDMQDARFVYDPGQPDQPPMRIQGLTTKINLVAKEKGWYDFDFNFGRDPLMVVDASGRFNIDRLAADFDQLGVDVDLGSEGAQALPPQVQQLLNKHEVTGHLQADFSGDIALENWQEANLRGKVRIDQAKFAQGDYQLPVKNLEIALSAEDRQASVTRLELATLDGTITGTAEMAIDSPNELSADIQIDHVDLQRAMRVASGQNGGDSGLAGRIRGQVQANTKLTSPLQTTYGEGEIRLRQGRLAAIPIVDDILGVLRSASDLIRGADSDSQGRDQADLEFTFEGDHAKFTRIQASTPYLAVDGEGTIGFDRQLDLLASAGPVQKVQNQLGEFGKIVGTITNRLARYRITGTLQEPQVGLTVGR